MLIPCETLSSNEPAEIAVGDDGALALSVGKDSHTVARLSVDSSRKLSIMAALNGIGTGLIMAYLKMSGFSELSIMAALNRIS